METDGKSVPMLSVGDYLYFAGNDRFTFGPFRIGAIELGGINELTRVYFDQNAQSGLDHTIDAWEATSLRERLSAIYREYFPIVINGHRLKESTVRGAFWFRSTVESWPLQLNWIPPEIERGFRKHLACTWETWRTEHEKIRAWQPITEVTLTTRPEWYGYEGNFATSHSSSHSTSWDAFRLKDDEVIITRKQYDEEKRIGDVYYEQTLLRCRYPGVEFKVEAGTGQGGDAIMTGGRPPSLSHFRQAVVNTLRTSIGEDARQILAVVEEVEFITVPELHVDRSRYIRPHLCNPPSARMTEQGPMVNYGQVAMTLHRLHMPPNYPNCTGVYWGRCSGCQRFFVGLREGAP
jgi:hypothetical protein